MMKREEFLSWRRLPRQGADRRHFLRGAGAATGAGLVLGAGLPLAALAEEAEQESCPDLARPIPHISSPPGAHFFFPGPVDTNPVTSPNKGHDPSLITNFKGIIGQADLFFAGTGTDLNTGASMPYGFHTDWRFMTGKFVAIDGLEHHGTLTFI